MGRQRRSMRGLRTGGLRTLLLVVYPLLAIVVVPLGLVGRSQGFRARELFGDPGHELGVLWGIFSFFGILMWAAASACCAVAWASLTRTSRSHPLRPWFLASTVLSIALTVDDTFLIHDIVLPDDAGIPELLVLAVYSVGIGWYVLRFRHELFERQDSSVLMTALILLGVSFAMDVASLVMNREFPYANTVEDGTKLLGITAWLFFFFRATVEVLTGPPSVDAEA